MTEVELRLLLARLSKLYDEPRTLIFKVSDTPLSGPEENSGHAHAAPHNNKEIA